MRADVLTMLQSAQRYLKAQPWSWPLEQAVNVLIMAEVKVRYNL